MNEFKNKVVIITGGSAGIGKATAKAFAKRGSKVVIASRGIERGQKAVEEIKAIGGKALFISTDVSQTEEVNNLVQKTVEIYGRLDFAFNNAYSFASGLGALTADFNEDEFDITIAVNLKGVWSGMKYEIQQMLRQEPPGGVIVNTSSISGLGGYPTCSIYNATKAGIIALTKTAAQEYATQGIRINCLVPGRIYTDSVELTKESEKWYESQIAVGRIGRADEAADAVLWLCSNAASYVIGHSLIVDGGMTANFR